MTRDRVFVEGLALDASVGVLDSERDARQPLVVDIEMEVDAGAPVEGGLASVVDYRVAAGHARRIVDAGHIELVETFAERLAGACLGDPRVTAVRVRARKPGAVAGAEAAGVEIVRRRDGA